MTTRRSLLAALGTAAGGSLAGCSITDGSPGGGTGEPATVSYRQWLADPSIFEVETYVLPAVAPTPLIERDDEFADRTVPDDPRVPVIGVDDHETVDEYVYFGRHGAAASGTFDPGPVVDALEERGYAPADSIRGVDGYESADGNAGVVDDGLLVLAGGGDAARDRVAALLATREGERDRYHEADADVAAALEAIDDGQIVSVVGGAGTPSGLEGGRALAYSASLGDDGMTAAMAVAYPEGETDSERLEQWANQGSMFYGADVTASTVGRAVRVEATVDLSRVTGFPVTTRLFPLPASAGTDAATASE